MQQHCSLTALSSDRAGLFVQPYYTARPDGMTARPQFGTRREQDALGLLSDQRV